MEDKIIILGNLILTIIVVVLSWCYFFKNESQNIELKEAIVKLRKAKRSGVINFRAIYMISLFLKTKEVSGPTATFFEELYNYSKLQHFSDDDVDKEVVKRMLHNKAPFNEILKA